MTEQSEKETMQIRDHLPHPTTVCVCLVALLIGVVAFRELVAGSILAGLLAAVMAGLALMIAIMVESTNGGAL